MNARCSQCRPGHRRQEAVTPIFAVRRGQRVVQGHPQQRRVTVEQTDKRANAHGDGVEILRRVRPSRVGAVEAIGEPADLLPRLVAARVRPQADPRGALPSACCVGGDAALRRSASRSSPPKNTPSSGAGCSTTCSGGSNRSPQPSNAAAARACIRRWRSSSNNPIHRRIAVPGTLPSSWISSCRFAQTSAADRTRKLRDAVLAPRPRNDQGPLAVDDPPDIHACRGGQRQAQHWRRSYASSSSCGVAVSVATVRPPPVFQSTHTPHQFCHALAPVAGSDRPPSSAAETPNGADRKTARKTASASLIGVAHGVCSGGIPAWLHPIVLKVRHAAFNI